MHTMTRMINFFFLLPPLAIFIAIFVFSIVSSQKQILINEAENKCIGSRVSKALFDGCDHDATAIQFNIATLPAFPILLLF